MPGRRVMTNKKFNELNLNNVTSLKPGEDYNDLKPNYVIFICTFDPFGKKLYRYTYENYCRETNLPLEDGTTKIFLNTKGKNQQLHVIMHIGHEGNVLSVKKLRYIRGF